MLWLLFAFSGPVLWALSTHVDKHLVERYFKRGNIAVLMVFTAILGAAALPVIWLFDPRVIALDALSAAVIVASGLLYMTAIYFYLVALQTEEASTVSPFFQAVGIFGAVLGYVVLGERLSFAQILGVLLIIGGSVLLSLHFHRDSVHVKVKARLVLLMLAAALAIAISSLIFKFFAAEDQFWATTFWNFVGQALFGAIVMLVASNRRQLAKMMRANAGAVISVNAANELINLGGNLGMRYALMFAPLGIVQAISSTTSFFVLFFSIILSVFIPKFGREEMAFASLLQKISATALVVAGVILVNMP